MIRFKTLYTCFFMFLMLITCGVQYASAQAPPPVRVPRPSQKASVMQTIGVTDLTITYSRPGIKGRMIWGDAPATATARVKGDATLDDQNARQKGEPIVPYGHVWRTGANEATQFSVSDDVLVNGQPLKAGTYSLHTIPGREEWTIIFNSDAGQWGSFTYDGQKDVLRVKAKPQMIADNQEWLIYSFDPVTDNSAQVNIRWEKVSVPFTVEVKDVAALTLQKARAAVAAAKADDWRTPFQAANYALQSKNEELGAQWLEQSIKIKPTFQNLSAKANMLFSAGKKDEALVIAEQAIQQGKTDKVDTARFEKRVADMKAGKM
jgi:hypothetical protein